MKGLAAILLLGAALLPRSAQASPTLTTTVNGAAASTVGITSTDSVVLTIAGLTPGDTILWERFLDLNGSGVIDAGDRLVQSAVIQDGVRTGFSGQRNRNIPGDDNGGSLTTGGADGTVVTHFSLPTSPELAKIAGTYLLRITDQTTPANVFSDVAFTVTQTADSQTISGQVTYDGNPLHGIPHAMVGMLQAGGDGNFLWGVVADGSGNYSINAPVGSYQMVPVAPGYVANLGSAPTVNLTVSGATSDITMVPATATISGSVQDSGNASLTLAGAQLFVQSQNGLIAIPTTDAAGNFSAGVTADQWEVDVDSTSLAAHGYVAQRNKPTADTTGGDVTGLAVTFPKQTALIYGTVTNNAAAPLAGIRVQAGDNGNTYEVDTVTDAQGRYSLGVLAGTWYVEPDNSSPGLAGYIPPSGTSVAPTASQAVAANFVALTATSHLQGIVTNNGTPVAGLQIGASLQNSNTFLTATADGTGHFDIPVVAGTWSIVLDNNTAASNNLVGANVGQTIADNQTISGIAYTVKSATGVISGLVKDGGDNPLPDVNVYAYASIGGVTYNAGGRTDGSGHYSFPVINGSWTVGVNGNGLTYTNQSATVSGPTTTVNFAPIVFTAHFQGTVMNGAAPVSGVLIGAYLQSINLFVQTTTDGSGHFDLGVIAGSWTISVQSSSVNALNLVCEAFNNQVITDGQTISGLTLHVLTSGGTISGTILDYSGNPAAGVFVGASATIGGVSYSASAQTDSGGHYSFRAADGTWGVVPSGGGLNFNFQNVPVTGSATADFHATVITASPGNQTVSAGGTTNLNVSTNAPGVPTLQWELSTDGGSTWGNVPASSPYSGTTGGMLGINPITYALNGYRYRCVVTYNSGANSETTSAATLTVNAALPFFTSSPSPQNVTAGQTATFTAAASGDPAPALQWQRSTDGGSVWSDLSEGAPYTGVQGTTLSVATVLAMHGDQFRCKATNVGGAVTSGTTALTVNPASVAPAITADPGNQTVGTGLTASFSVTATGTPAPTYQWQFSSDGGATWNDLSDGGAYGGALLSTLSVTASPGLNGYRYRCLAHNSGGTATSGAGILGLTVDFNFWLATYFTADELLNHPELTGPNVVYGQDGLTNLVKYTLGLDPKQNATSGLPVVTTTPTEWVYTYTRSSTATDVTCAVEVSTNLTAWTTAGVTHEFVSAGAGTETWHARYPLASAANVFFRLKVTRP